MGQDSWTSILDETVDAHFEQMVEVRRHMHAHPELSGQEIETTAYLLKLVRAAGLQARSPASGLGLIVEPRQQEVARIGLRADIDALPIQDAKPVDYRSQCAGAMHACGHDAHAATVMGALLSLAAAQREDKLPWPITYRAIFQPAEETNRGALEMIEASVLDGLEALLSLHVDPSRSAGHIGIKTGVLTADCVELQIDVHGRGGHAARPHESLDPIAAAAQLISSIYLFVPRGVDSHEPAVVTIGQIHGGHCCNVIPDHVQLHGTMRTLGESTRRAAMDHIEQLARGIAEASGTSMDVSFRPGPPAVINDPGLTRLLRSTANELLGVGCVHEIPKPSMGGEDFAHYVKHVPGSMFRLGCAPRTTDNPTLHSHDFDIDERALAVGAKILARSVVKWFDPSRQSQGSSTSQEIGKHP